MRKSSHPRPGGSGGRRNPTEEENTLGALLRGAYDALAARVYAEVGAEFPGVRHAHSAVLRHILPDGSRATDLAERAGMTKQSMAYLLDTLHDRGYLAFVPDPDDGRAKLAVLTERGAALHRRLIEASRRAEADADALLADLGGVAVLRESLARLAAHVPAEEVPGAPGAKS
jgi:DNA-binding MarR family transcriptional regulator